MSHQPEFDFSQRVENNIESQTQLALNGHKFNKQCKLVHDLLMQGIKLTTRKALLQYNIGDLRRRIKDLTDPPLKLPVQKKWIDTDGSRFKEYFLEPIKPLTKP